VFSASIAGAAFGFLLFNFHPATVYMGDTGSMFLGLALAVAVMGVLMLVFGAIKLKTSQGNPQAQQQAKVTIAGAIAGLLLVVFAKDIIGLILNAKGH